jgi:AraC-like DNA-binding protein
MFVYVLLMIKENGRFKSVYLLHGIPFLAFTVFMMFDFYFLDTSEKLAYYEQMYTKLPLDLWIASFPNILSGPVYVILSLVLLSRHSNNIVNSFSYKEQINLNWLRNVIGGLGFIYLVVIVSNILVRFPFLSMEMHEHLIYFSISIAVFFLGYFGIKQQAIYQSDPRFIGQTASKPPEEKKASQYLHSGLKQEEAERHAAVLKAYFEREKPYLDGKLSIGDVADYMKISVNHLSQVINEQLGMTFFDFVNSFRVDEVKTRLSSPDVQNFTLLGMAYESGFNSKSSFNSIFKKFTGLTPSQFTKQNVA